MKIQRGKERREVKGEAGRRGTNGGESRREKEVRTVKAGKPKASRKFRNKRRASSRKEHRGEGRPSRQPGESESGKQVGHKRRLVLSAKGEQKQEPGDGGMKSELGRAWY